MFAKHHQRLHVVVLIVFLYQMNVCPCGHLEHNGWYLLAKSLLASPALACGQHDSLDGLSVESEDAHDCEAPELTYLVAQRVDLDSLRDSATIGHFVSAELADAIAMSLGNSASQAEAPKPLLALEMRSQLQVFLL